MKFQGNIKVAQEGILVIDIENNRHLLPLLEVGKSYDIDIKEHRSHKTLSQNRYLWHNIGLIARKLTEPVLKTYCDILERANCKSTFIAVESKEAGETLRMSVRAARFISKIEINGKLICHYLLDFKVEYGDGRIEYIDVKGISTPVYRIKRKLIESIYPFKIKEVKKGQF